MSSWKKTRPKIRGKKDVVDEWEIMDIDRDQQKAGLKRRERRWKEIEKERVLAKRAEKVAIKNAEKMGNFRKPNQIEMAWIRCDYVLSNIMQIPAYSQMEYYREKDPECYKALYKVFMSPYMMSNIQYFVDYFANGGVVKKKITLANIYKYYKKYYNIKNNIVVKHKNEKDRKL